MAMVYLPFIPMSEIKNRSAYHEYFIDDKYEAGIVLMGTEVKSIREGKVSFNDSYCLLHKGEVFVKSLHIAEYSHGNINNHEPSRDRKLLLQKREIRKIESKLKEKGYTLIPLRIYFSEKGLAKMDIGLGKGKKLHDKRETLRKKDVEREMKRYTN
ncbi:MAG TPA: SsrA-binding protein SmpB [Chitinophagaceae bacterium]|nr:SsrA-binding protein SmpB [Chitinophagaceae bacterium]